MPEAEISPSGEVLVEGHHVGELQGFRFTADQSAEGEDAKAVRSAAQKALAAEFEARAERFASAANGDFALASDGTLRWIGSPVATVVAGDDPLKPRVILLADEQLSGPSRDKAQARADRFVNFQIETFLKPLVDLRDAEQLSGMARGIAFRLVENFGLINRRDVASDVKALDQEARGALRRLGVRFGAYHIFIPALIKPAPAGLLTLLWALVHDGKEKAGFGDVVHALAAGRTSLVRDPAFDPAFYRLAGFRLLGRRAVRVDILERLADIIRPALAWKTDGSVRPTAAFDGNAFLVTPAMMSILGAKADDMEEILKGLGYRAEVKPAAEIEARIDTIDAAYAEAEAKKAEEKRREATASEAGVSEQTTDAGASGQQGQSPETPTDAATASKVTEEISIVDPVEADRNTPVSENGPSGGRPSEEAEPAAVERAQAETALSSGEIEEAAQIPHEPRNTGSGEAPVAAEQPAEARTIMLWRPGRHEARPRPQHFRKGRNGAQVEGGSPKAGSRPEGKEGFDRRFSGGGKGKPNDRRDGRQDRSDHAKGATAKGKQAFGGRRHEEKPRTFDPDSPFAKLAALREQLKK